MAKTGATKPRQAKNKRYLLARYSRMGLLGVFEHYETHIPRVPTRVVVKTEKGLELGYLVGQLAPYKAGQFKLSNEQIKKYFDNSELDFPEEPAGKFIRFATGDDISEERHLQTITQGEIRCCRDFIDELALPMKIVDAEHIFGGERIIFYFMAEARVDFRELVKKLAHEYQTRIEMRQIGSRDEAKLLGDVESCGQQCCCIRFLKSLKSVNMRMAKMQKATLDPSKISGYCGRLRCCLRYEDQTYTELKKRLPKKGTIVKTQHGQGRVVGSQILTQLVVVEQEKGARIAVGVDELEIVSAGGETRKRQSKNLENDKQDDKKEQDKQEQDKQEQDKQEQNKQARQP